MNKMTVLDFVLKIEHPRTMVRIYDSKTHICVLVGAVMELITLPIEHLEIVSIIAINSDFYIWTKRIEEQK